MEKGAAAESKTITKNRAIIGSMIIMVSCLVKSMMCVCTIMIRVMKESEDC